MAIAGRTVIWRGEAGGIIAGSMQYSSIGIVPGTSYLLVRSRAELTRAHEFPGKIIICGDGETGPGIQFDYGTAMPATMALGAADDEQLTKRFAKWAGQGFRRLGVDVVFTPQADLFHLDSPTVLGWRCFGGDPKDVHVHLDAYIQGLREGGVFPVVKHYPGHGLTTVDTHQQLGVTTANAVRSDVDASVFERLATDGVGFGIMFGFLAVPELQGTIEPAAVSSYWMTRLRHGAKFQGPLFTDSLAMKPASMRIGSNTLFATAATANGIDYLLEPNDVRSLRRDLRQAASANIISKEFQQDSSKRRYILERDVAQLRNVNIPPEKEWFEQGQRLGGELAEAGMVSFGTAEPGLLEEGKTTVLLAHAVEPNSGLSMFQREIASYLRAPTHVWSGDEPFSGKVLLLYWKGGAGSTIGEPWSVRQLKWLDDAHERNVQIRMIVFGNPLAGFNLRNYDNICGIVTWGRAPVCCKAAIAWLKGEVQPRGKWPFAL